MALEDMRIHHIDDETIEFHVNGTLLTGANHDEHGWAGMESLTNMFKNLAKFAGIKVRDTYPEDDE